MSSGNGPATGPFFESARSEIGNRASRVRGTADWPAVDEEARPETVAEREEDHVAAADRGARCRFSYRSQEVVIVDHDRDSHSLAQQVDDRRTTKAGQIGRKQDSTGRRIDDPRYACRHDPHRGRWQ